MEDLTALERSVLEALLAGPGRGLGQLRQQAETCRVDSREFTGVGFYTHFVVDARKSVKTREDVLRVYGADANIEGLQCGAGFLLFIKNGLLQVLEGYTYDEPWPDKAKTFSVQAVDVSQRGFPPELME